MEIRWGGSFQYSRTSDTSIPWYQKSTFLQLALTMYPPNETNPPIVHMNSSSRKNNPRLIARERPEDTGVLFDGTISCLSVGCVFVKRLGVCVGKEGFIYREG